jgi:hypothetical protein
MRIGPKTRDRTDAQALFGEGSKLRPAKSTSHSQTVQYTKPTLLNERRTIVGGMFAAALIFSIVFYALQRATAVVLGKTLPVKTVIRGDVVPLFGWLLRFSQIATVLLSARWLFYRFG